MKYLFFVINAVFFLSLLACKEQSKGSQNNKPVFQKKDSTGKILLRFAGSIEFTRSYSEIQSMTDDKKIDRYLEKVRKSNPYQSPDYGDENSNKQTEQIRKRFEELGFVKGHELLEDKATFNSQLEYSLTDLSGKEIELRIVRDSMWHEKVVAVSGSDSSVIKARFMMGPLSALLDIVPGGNKELVIHSANYGSNTEFYYFEVYEIRIKE